MMPLLTAWQIVPTSQLPGRSQVSGTVTGDAPRHADGSQITTAVIATCDPVAGTVTTVNGKTYTLAALSTRTGCWEWCTDALTALQADLDAAIIP